MKQLFAVLLCLLLPVLLLAQTPPEVDGFQLPFYESYTQTCNFAITNCAVPGEYHLAEDYNLSVNDSVYACADGIVKEAQTHGGYGGTVLIEHLLPSGEYVVSLYAHMFVSSLTVSSGDTVVRGELLGKIADSNNNGGWTPHLHFGISKGQYESTTSCDGSGWIYQGYSGNSCTLNEWYDPSDFLAAHPARVAYYSDGWHEGGSDPSQPILDAYNEHGGYTFFGTPTDFGGGAEAHTWPSQGDPSEQDVAVLQDFEDASEVHRAIALSPGRGKGFKVEPPISTFWFDNTGYENYGSPMSNPESGRYVGTQQDLLVGPILDFITVQKFAKIGGSRKTIAYHNSDPANTVDHYPIGKLNISADQSYEWWIDGNVDGDVDDAGTGEDIRLFTLAANQLGWVWVDDISPQSYNVIRVNPSTGEIVNASLYPVFEGNSQHIDPAGDKGTDAPVLGTPTVNSSSWVDLSWTDSNDPDATPYKVYRDGAEVGETSSKSFTDQTTVVGQTYTYSVAGNGTAESDFETITVTDEGGAGAPAPVGDLRVVFPNQEGDFMLPTYEYNILWNGSDASSVQIELSMDNGQNWTHIDYYANVGKYFWKVPEGNTSDECLIRITNQQDTQEWDVSDNVFTIGNPNDPPTAVSFADTTAYPDTLFIDLSSRVTDHDGDVEWSTLSITSITNGTASFDEANTTIKFVPDYGYFGPAEVRYKVKDDDDEYSNEAIISIDVIVITSQTRNSDFATGDTTDWDLNEGDASDWVIASNSHVPDPTYYLDIEAPSNYWGSPPDTLVFSQDRLHFEAGTHRISFYGYNVLRESNVWVSIVDRFGDVIDSDLADVGNRFAWNLYNADLTIPADTVECKLVFKCQSTTSLAADLEMDNIRITPIGQLGWIQNSGFEDNFDNWEKDPTSSPFYVSVYGSDRFEGSKYVSCRIASGNQGFIGKIYQEGIDLATGDNTLSFLQRFKDAMNQMDLSVSLHPSGGGAYYDSVVVDLSATSPTDWKKRTAELSLAQDVEDAVLVFTMKNTSVFNVYMYLDYITFEYDPDHVKEAMGLGKVGIQSQSPITQRTIPDEFQLFQNYPNPFNPTTNIRFSLPKAVQTKVEVYNIIGQRVITLLDKVTAAGQHNLIWDSRDSFGRQVATGIYIYRLQAGNFVQSRKMLLLK